MSAPAPEEPTSAYRSEQPDRAIGSWCHALAGLATCVPVPGVRGALLCLLLLRGSANWRSLCLLLPTAFLADTLFECIWLQMHRSLNLSMDFNSGLPLREALTYALPPFQTRRDPNFANFPEGVLFGVQVVSWHALMGLLCVACLRVRLRACGEALRHLWTAYLGMLFACSGVALGLWTSTGHRLDGLSAPLLVVLLLVSMCLPWLLFVSILRKARCAHAVILRVVD